MDFINTHWTELLIGVLGSLLATAIVGLIAWTRKLPAVPVPLWIFALVIAFPIIWLITSRFHVIGPVPVINQEFHTQRISLDGKEFIRCKFDRCDLVFKGEAPFGFESCSFTAPKIVFESAAGLTAFQLGRMRNDPTLELVVQEAIKKQ